jgi:hypothetical protein
MALSGQMRGTGSHPISERSSAAAEVPDMWLRLARYAGGRRRRDVSTLGRTICTARPNIQTSRYPLDERGGSRLCRHHESCDRCAGPLIRPALFGACALVAHRLPKGRRTTWLAWHSSLLSPCRELAERMPTVPAILASAGQVRGPSSIRTHARLKTADHRAAQDRPHP